MSDVALSGRPGRPEQPGRPTIAVDIGGTKIVVALTSPAGVIDRIRLETAAFSGPGELVSGVAAAAWRLAARNGNAGLGQAVLAVPGLLDRAAGIVLAAANLPFRNFPLAAELSAALGGIPAILESDANCGALGEVAFGSASGSNDMCYLTISTGIGMGIISGGELMSGASGHAGEIGHVPVVPGGRQCRCGNRGCLEAYASGWALTELGAQLQASRDADPQPRRDADRLATAQDVVEAAELGDLGCGEILGEAVELLTYAIQVVQRLLNPGAIVLGGGLMASDYFFGRISSSLLARARPTGPVESIVRGMPGEDAVLLGGLRLLQMKLPEPASEPASGPALPEPRTELSQPRTGRVVT